MLSNIYCCAYCVGKVGMTTAILSHNPVLMIVKKIIEEQL